MRRASRRMGIAVLCALLGGFSLFMAGWWLLLAAIPSPEPPVGTWAEARPGLLGLAALPLFPFVMLGVLRLLAPARSMPLCPACGERLSSHLELVRLTARCPHCTAAIIDGRRGRRPDCVARWNRRKGRHMIRRLSYAVTGLGVVAAVALWWTAWTAGFVVMFNANAMAAATWVWLRERPRGSGTLALLNAAVVASLVVHVWYHWP